MSLNVQSVVRCKAKRKYWPLNEWHTFRVMKCTKCVHCLGDFQVEQREDFFFETITSNNWNGWMEWSFYCNEYDFAASLCLSYFFFTCFHLNDSSWMHLQDCIHPLFPLHQKKRLEYMFYICTGPIVRFVSIRFDFKTIKPSKHLQRISGSSFRKKFFIYISQNIRKWFVCKISRFVIDLVHSCIENCSFVLEVRLQW